MLRPLTLAITGACAADDHHHLATAGNRILQQLRSRGNRRATCPSVFAHEDAGVHPDRLVGQGSEGASSETSGAAAAQLVAAGSEAAGSPLAVMTDASSGMLCSEGGTSSGMLAGEGEHPLTPVSSAGLLVCCPAPALPAHHTPTLLLLSCMSLKSLMPPLPWR